MDTTKGAKCHGCRQVLNGRVVTVGAKQFHQACFICCNCRRPIPGAYIQESSDSGKEGYSCENCYQRMHPTKTCVACSRAIVGQVVMNEGRSFHPGCFVCSRCRLPLEGGFFRTEDGNGRLCTACQPLCDVCGTGAGSLSIKVGRLRLHPQCFKCPRCGQVIEGNIFPADLRNPIKGAVLDGFQCQRCHSQAMQDAAAAQERILGDGEEYRKHLTDENLLEGEGCFGLVERCLSGAARKSGMPCFAFLVMHRFRPIGPRRLA